MERIGPYRVLSVVASGGMGAVFKAQGPQGRAVAVKVLLAHRAKDPRARRRFQTEVEALSRLRHPNVVSILAAGEHEGAPWLAMDYVSGEPLDEVLRRGPLSVPAAIRIAQQLARALAYVHGCGVLHRDLKPANVLQRGDQALLTDFGLALDVDPATSRLTATGEAWGTPGYWAPEQALGKKSEIGPRTDVYGLGAVLYACLTGEPPVQAATFLEHVAATQVSQVTSPRDLRREVPEWLDHLCMRCLSLNPADRPDSLQAVGRALALGETAAARRGRPALLVMGGVAACLAVGLGALLLGGAFDEHAPSPVAEPTADDSTADDAARILEIGIDKAERGLHEEALADYAQALALDPLNPIAIAHQGAAKENLGRYDDALIDYARALELDPECGLAHANRGAVWGRQGRYLEALVAFDRALELEPDDPRNKVVYTNRAVACTRLERYAEALADFDRALELDPNRVATYGMRGTTFLRMQRYGEALEDFERAIELDPNSALAWFNSGQAKASLERRDEALADYSRALELNPGLGGAYYERRGLLLAELRRWHEALEDFDHALGLDLDPAVRERILQRRAQVKAQLGE